VLVHTDKGQMIPLASVASVKEATGFSNINRENGKRYITVQCNARGRDIGSIVAESKGILYSQLSLPFGYYLTWGGQFELKQRAEKRLYVVLFITFFLIVVLLFDYLKRWRDIVVILINLPVSLSGGLLSLWLAGAYLSVPSTIGFLALLGIALENTLILISFFKRMTGEKKDFDAAIRESVGLRLRPILMTKFTTIIGLFPLLFSVGIGSEIQKPLVIVVIGGIFFSIFTTLLLMPVIYKKFYKN
jgi:cobalt-zinc-cadmium resistance protein CzcA